MKPTKPRLPSAPAGISAQALGVWRDVLETYDLAAADVALLARAVTALTIAARAEQVVLRGGLTMVNRLGETVPHPAEAVARFNRAAYEKLLRALNLPDPAQTKGRDREA